MIPQLFNTPWLIDRPGMDMILSIAARKEITEAVLSAYKDGRQPKDVAVEAAKGEKLRDDKMSAATLRNGVAVIPVVGPIFRHASMFDKVSGATSIEVLGLDLAEALKRPDVRGILLNVDSPGGEVNGTAELARTIRAADSKKPVTAYSGGSASSGAYWLATAAGEFVLAETAHAGSIGVIIEFMDETEMEAKLGIKRDFVRSSGAPKKWLDPFKSDGRSALQDRANEIEDEFVGAVARQLGVDKSVVLKDFGQGGTLMGRRAVSAGMADRVGTFEGVLRDLSRGRPRPAARDGVPAVAFAEDGGPIMAKGSFKGFLMSYLGQADEEEAKDIARGLVGDDKATEAHPQIPVGKSAREIELEAQVRSGKLELITSEAERFADSVKAKIAPAERAAVVQQFTIAATDDLDRPVAQGQPTRVQALTAMFAARPKSILTDEMLDADPPAGAKSLSGADPGEKDPKAAARQKEIDEAREDARKDVARRNGKPIKA